jgi:predicted nucleic acid-binding protein
MTPPLQDVFADTSFWIALVVKQDQYHDRAQKWSVRITTTVAVLLEAANALARPTWRSHAVALIDHLQQRPDVGIVELAALPSGVARSIRVWVAAACWR